MKNVIPVCLALAGALALSACAFNPPGERLTEEHAATRAMDSGFGDAQAAEDLTQAEMAAARGDWPVSAMLAEKSYREEPGVWSEFNLATADQHIGRNDLAEPLYLDLVQRGQFTPLESIQNFDGSWPHGMIGNIAEEANRRLDGMGYGGVSPEISNTVGPFPVLAE